MKIVTVDQTQKFKNSDNCEAVEYPLGDKDINGAVIKLSGRYPEKGYVTNKVCKELVYVVEGEGLVITSRESQKLKRGDLALIHPGEKYYFEGKLTMFMPCSPAWYPEQHEQVQA